MMENTTSCAFTLVYLMGILFVSSLSLLLLRVNPLQNSINKHLPIIKIFPLCSSKIHSVFGRLLFWLVPVPKLVGVK